MTDLSMFVDSITVIKELNTSLVNLTSLAVERREYYRDILDRTCTLLDHALLIVVQRLDDTLRLRKSHGDIVFMDELYHLQFASNWEKIDREVRLLRALKESGDDMRHLYANIGSKLYLADGNKFWTLVSCVLDGENLFANQLSHALSTLSKITDADIASIEVEKSISELKTWRLVLIESQIDLMRNVQ